MPDPQGPGTLWLLSQPKAGEEPKPLVDCQMEWSINIGNQKDGGGEDGQMMREYFEEEWPELARGTLGSEMLAQLAEEKRLLVVRTREATLLLRQK